MTEVEIWKDIEGFDGYYLISSFGNVKTNARLINSSFNATRTIKGQMLKPGLSGNGYYTVVLSKNNIRGSHCIHFLVCTAFYKKPVGDMRFQVNHKDGDKTNNHYTNLEWVTPSENGKHAHRIGIKVSKKGEQHQFASITDEQARIIKYNTNGMTAKQAAKFAGADSWVVAASIKSGAKWKHI